MIAEREREKSHHRRAKTVFYREIMISYSYASKRAIKNLRTAFFLVSKGMDTRERVSCTMQSHTQHSCPTPDTQRNPKTPCARLQAVVSVSMRDAQAESEAGTAR
jgi:hypothetical protein